MDSSFSSSSTVDAGSAVGVDARVDMSDATSLVISEGNTSMVVISMVRTKSAELGSKLVGSSDDTTTAVGAGVGTAGASVVVVSIDSVIVGSTVGVVVVVVVVIVVGVFVPTVGSTVESTFAVAGVGSSVGVVSNVDVKVDGKSVSLQQSKKTPFSVGQQSPSKSPHAGYAEHRGSTVGPGLTVGITVISSSAPVGISVPSTSMYVGKGVAT